MIGLAGSAARQAAELKPQLPRREPSEKTKEAVTTMNRVCENAPATSGLLITFSSDDGTDDEKSPRCRMEFVPDEHLAIIHPNAHGPASLTELEVLNGGGSGVRVFKGMDPVIGSLVMKHGGYRDAKELFALATIAQELRKRGGNVCMDPKNESNPCMDMLSRIPEFKMIYISPHHLTDKPKDLFHTLYKAATSIFFRNDVSDTNSNGDSNHSDLSENSEEGPRGKQICLYTSGLKDQVQIQYHTHRIAFVLGPDKSVQPENFGFSLRYGDGDDEDSYARLKLFLDKLIPKQKKYLWKFTQGQKTIGGPSPKTAFSHLAQGKLDGDLLETLISQYLQVIRNLQDLTLPREKDIIDKLRMEVDKLERDLFARPFDVSDDLDTFVGFALKKNYDPEKGRFYVLRRMGTSFRYNKYKLTEAEKLPGRLLGTILKTGAIMSDAFQDVPISAVNALDLVSSTQGKFDPWRTMVRDAVTLQCSAGLERVWNCGITDGGLHNLFLSSDKVWLFDLGEPTVQPLPAFLTKFLFSFFHSLGMVDDKLTGGWVNRFDPGGAKVSLTVETKQLIPQAYDAFKTTLDRFMNILFDDEEAVRSLLITYVTFQLLSDASFCLNKWSVKGGGRSQGTNHHRNLEKWLWRALWDIYIASDLNTTRRLRQVGVTSVRSSQAVRQGDIRDSKKIFENGNPKRLLGQSLLLDDTTY